MFLDVLRRRNPAFLEAVIALHREQRLPAGAYVLDLDAVQANAAAIRREADRLGLQALAMTKQVGRAPGFLEAVRAGGLDAGVAVDMACARALRAGGLRLGHVGHLVQVPRAEAVAAATLEPDGWCVFSDAKAAEAAAASRAAGREQALIARIHAPGDRFYAGHEGGFEAAEVVAVAKRLDALDGARFAGITTFPALLYDAAAQDVRPTANMATLVRAAEALRAAGFADVRVNAPGTTSAAVLPLLAESGATQVEPGHGLTGTTPLHAVRDLEELPAACYLTEVSHHHGGRGYVFGGGFYIDPVFGDYRLRALVAEAPGLGDARLLDASIPPPEAIDYYGQLDAGDGRLPTVGATAVFGFRIQAFVTRAYVAGLRGVAAGRPEVAGIWTSDGREGAMAAVSIAPLIEIDRVRKEFGAVVALEEVTLDVRPGEIVALVGDNGAGKSTLVKMIAGVHQPTSGEIRLEGEPVTLASPADSRRHGIEVVYQDLALADDQPVYMNMFLGRELVRGPLRILDRGRMAQETQALLDELDVRIPSPRATIRDLSGGQRQGVAICRATHWADRLVLMDEPTAALGVQETRRVEEIIARMRERGRAILIVSHSLDQVFRLSDRICVLRRGVQVGIRDTRETDGDEIVAMITGLR